MTGHGRERPLTQPTHNHAHPPPHIPHDAMHPLPVLVHEQAADRRRPRRRPSPCYCWPQSIPAGTPHASSTGASTFAPLRTHLVRLPPSGGPARPSVAEALCSCGSLFLEIPSLRSDWKQTILQNASASSWLKTVDSQWDTNHLGVAAPPLRGGCTRLPPTTQSSQPTLHPKHRPYDSKMATTVTNTTQTAVAPATLSTSDSPSVARQPAACPTSRT